MKVYLSLIVILAISCQRELVVDTKYIPPDPNEKFSLITFWNITPTTNEPPAWVTIDVIPNMIPHTRKATVCLYKTGVRRMTETEVLQDMARDKVKPLPFNYLNAIVGDSVFAKQLMEQFTVCLAAENKSGNKVPLIQPTGSAAPTFLLQMEDIDYILQRYSPIWYVVEKL